MNTNQTLAPAGFWIRLLTRIIDTIIPSSISVAVLFGFIQKDTYYHFKEDWMYYVWTIITSLLLVIQFIVIPYLTKGRTIAMFMTRTKIEFEKKPLLSLFKREMFFSLAWVIMLLIAMAVINHTLVNDFARTDQKSLQSQYSNLDKLRIGVIGAMGAIMTVIQLLSVVGIIAKRDKRGFHDRASDTTTVWVNKKTVIKDTKFIKHIEPRLVNDEKIEWID